MAAGLKPVITERAIITAALPYANGEIHLGHIVSTYLPADVFTRFCRLKGREVAYVCATDDFGTPILVKAEQEGKTPEEYVRYWNERDLKDFRDLGMSFDVFYRTSSPENVALAQRFFNALNEKGLIYKKEIEQPYCQKDGKFLPDRYLKGTCPHCKAADQYSDVCESCGRTLQGELLDVRCAICGTAPVTKKASHFFFRLSAMSERLAGWLSGNKNLQPEVRNYVLSWIREGLKDWDITRDISWGVPIPGAEGQVLYGWFDNHIGYISSFEKYAGPDYKELWNSSKIYHFVGKDIIYHHLLFLPAMRMGEGTFKLPDFVPVRGHLTLEGQKFSKSRGHYVSVREFLNKYPADYLRYYLSTATPYGMSDVNFDWQDFAARINNELAANFGNFAHRTLHFVYSKYGGKVPPAITGDGDFLGRMKACCVEAGKLMDEMELMKALHRVMEFSAEGNAYFQKSEPWKAQGPERDECIALCVSACASLAIMLFPFIPHSAAKLWDTLNLADRKMEWDSAAGFSVPVTGHMIKKPEILFGRAEV